MSCRTISHLPKAPRSHFLGWSLAVAWVVFWGLGHSCGKKESGDNNNTAAPKPTATPTPSPTPSPTPTPIPFGVRDFWVGNTNNRILARYDANGSLKNFVDLQNLATSGGVTAIEYLDGNNLVAVLDPGADGGESIVSINPTTAVVKSPTWYKSSTTFHKISSDSLVASAVAGSLLAPTGTAVERLIYNANGAFRLVAADGTSAYITKLGGACESDKIQLISSLVHKGNKFLAVFSSGNVGRINVAHQLDSAPKCLSSHDYTASGLPTKSTHVPSAAVQMSDGKLYVLYQEPSNPLVMRYTFNGTLLEAPEVVFSDSSVLGSLPKGLAQRSDTSFLIGNTNADKIFEISFAGAYTGFFLQSSFTIDVSFLKTAPK